MLEGFLMECTCRNSEVYKDRDIVVDSDTDKVR